MFNPEKDELIEYYSEEGKKLGLVQRSIAHEKGLWHKGVHVWLFNSKNELFMKKRSKSRKLFPEHWEDVGEHLKPDESFEQAALRGLKEELNIDESKIKSLRFILSTKLEFPKTNREFVQLWFCFYDGPIEVKEGYAGRFFSLEEIKRLLEKEKVTPWFKVLFAQILNAGLWPEKEKRE